MAKSWTPGTDVEQPIDRGYAIKRPNLSPDRAGQPQKDANAYFENGNGERVFMWVSDVEAQFAMTGSTAQSRAYRRFYPHNFAQPTCTISGQCPNQYEMGRLAEFIRDSQLLQLEDNPLLKFRLFTQGKDTARPLQKGKHRRISISGYVLNVPRTAERWVNAPEYRLEFAIAKAEHFLGLQDQVVSRVRLSNILDALQHGNYVKSAKEFHHSRDKRKDKGSTNDDGQPLPDKSDWY